MSEILTLFVYVRVVNLSLGFYLLYIMHAIDLTSISSEEVNLAKARELMNDAKNTHFLLINIRSMRQNFDSFLGIFQFLPKGRDCKVTGELSNFSA